MTVIYNMSIDRADKPWIGDRRLTEIQNTVARPKVAGAGSATASPQRPSASGAQAGAAGPLPLCC